MHQQLTRKSLLHLWWLRNIAIGFEIVILLLAALALGLPLPVAEMLVIIAVQLGVNAAVGIRLRQKRALRETWLILPLLVDVTGLFALLSLSGGASNPFTSLFILQVIVAATLLSPRQTWAVAGVAIGYYTLLIAFWTDDAAMGQHHGHGGNASFDLHVYGMWGSFVILALLVARFVTGMKQTIRRQGQLLAMSEQMAMLGTVATSAAHELGTPLSSIALLAELAENGKLDQAKVALLKGQILRCKEIVGQMALKAGLMRADGGQARDALEWLQTLLAGWQHEAIALDVTLDPTLRGRIVVADYTLEQAVINLLDNAAEASVSVRFDARVAGRMLVVTVRDEGDGFPQELLARDALQAPFDSSKPGGMGMGLYLTRLVAERLSGELTLKNDGGGCAVFSLPLARIGA